jgi:anthranilate synthase
MTSQDTNQDSVPSAHDGVRAQQSQFMSRGGVRIHRSVTSCDYEQALTHLRGELDSQRGVLLSSSFEYPGRYTRWDVGFVNPPIVFESRGLDIEISALNSRGRIILPEIVRALIGVEVVEQIQCGETTLHLRVQESHRAFAEEERSRQPSVFTVLRAIVDHFFSIEDSFLGLYGAFGYELTFQFEKLESRRLHDAQARDLVLYLPDELIVAEHQGGNAERYRYEFICRTGDGDEETLGGRETTGGLIRSGAVRGFVPDTLSEEHCDHAPGEYAETVVKAKQHFARGDLFEVVPGQVFSEPCLDAPSKIFSRLQKANPAPYGALMNLGDNEYLVSASPEMYVRVRGTRIETCPISGTIARGADAIEDELQIRKLLNSPKEEAELSMCTDVDRNDKSRVCIPGSVKVIGRRQVELYSRLIHTVDHVAGTLLPEFDALDAFLAHTWAVTVTGAPKQAAIQFIEDHEKSPRHWYGGAMGCIGFNGNMNTGLTLRSARIKDGVAQVRVGATLLSDSDPAEEEAETELKASAVLAAIRRDVPPTQEYDVLRITQSLMRKGAQNLRVLMVDHRDSFVHNLGSYFRELGVSLVTMRPELARERLQQEAFDLVILSPGPGRPQDFCMHDTLRLCEQARVPVFGVCLGLQGMVEYFGGSLAQLSEPVHGKPSTLSHRGGAMFAGCEQGIIVGRYHSLHVVDVPNCLSVQATTSDGVVMAVRHQVLPWMAVQFHPESIMSLAQQNGKRLIANVVQCVLSRQSAQAAKAACG